MGKSASQQAAMSNGTVRDVGKLLTLLDTYTDFSALEN